MALRAGAACRPPRLLHNAAPRAALRRAAAARPRAAPPAATASATEPVASYQQLFMEPHQHQQHHQQRQQPAVDAAAQAAGAARVHVSITRHLEYGQRMLLVGSSSSLGAWDTQHAARLAWHSGDRWSADVELPTGRHELKFVLAHRSGEMEWEPGANRTLSVPPSAAEMQLRAEWGATQDTDVLELQQQASWQQQLRAQEAAAEARLAAAQASADHKAAAASAAAEAADTLAGLDLRLEEAQQQRRQAPDAPHQARASASRQAPALQPRRAAPIAVAAEDLAAAEASNGLGSSDATSSSDAEATADEAPAHAAAAAPSLPGAAAGSAAAPAPGAGLLASEDEDDTRLARDLRALAALRDDPTSAHRQQLLAVLVGFRQDMQDALGSMASTMTELQGDLATVQQQVAQFSAPQPVAAGPAAAAAAGAAALLADEPPGAAAGATQGQVIAGLHAAVLSWRQELLSFRQESLELRQEVEELRTSLGGQVSDNTAAVRELQALVEQRLVPGDASGGGTSSSSSSSSGTAASGGKHASSGAGLARPAGPHSAQQTPLALEEQELLRRINQLADDLGSEVRQAVRTLEAHQQQLGARDPQHSTEHRQAAARLESGPAGRSASAAAQAAAARASSKQDGAAIDAAVEQWLQAPAGAEEYHRGLLVAVLRACGLWDAALWDELSEGGPLRSTWAAYCACHGTELLATLARDLRCRVDVLAGLASGRQQALSLHVLWSMQQLARDSPTLRRRLEVLASPAEHALLARLARDGGGGSQAGGGEAAPAALCAIVLQRWLADAGAPAAAL